MTAGEMRAGQEALRAEMKEGQAALWKAIDDCGPR
jgi:hypothetical protein